MSKNSKPSFLRRLQPCLAVCFSCVSVLTAFLAYAQEPASPYPDRIIIHPTIAIANYHELPLTEVLLSADVITQTEIEASNATSFSALISQKTGVEVTSTGGPGALRSHFLRGQSSTNYVLLIDGIKAQTDYYGNVKTPEIPLSQIQKIEILKGNGSALYGEGAIGGVVNVITKSARSKDSGYTSAQYGSYGTKAVNAGVSKYVNGFDISFDAGHFETEGFDAQKDAASNPDKDGLERDNYHFALSKRLSADTKINIGVKHTKSVLDEDNTNGGNIHVLETEYNDYFFSADWKKSAGINLEFDVSKAKLAYDNIIDGQPASQTIGWATDLQKGNQTFYKLVNTSFISTAAIEHALIQGVELSASDYDRDGSKSERDLQAYFLGYLGKAGAHSLQTNIRRDAISLKDLSTNNRAEMADTTHLIGYGYDFNPAYKISVTSATSFRAPDVGGYSNNPNVRPETHKSYEISLQRTGQNSFMRTTVFSTKTDDALEYMPVAPWSYSNIGRTQNEGIETVVRGVSALVDYDLNLTFQDPKKRDTTDASKSLLKRAKTYGKLTLSKSTKNDYKLGSTLTYSGPKQGVGGKIASYVKIDGFIARQLTDSVSLNLKAENIFDADYETTRGYNTPERSLFLTLQYDFVNAYE